MSGSDHDNEPLDAVVNTWLCELRDLIQKLDHKHYRMSGTIHLENKSSHAYFESQKSSFRGFRPTSQTLFKDTELVQRSSILSLARFLISPILE